MHPRHGGELTDIVCYAKVESSCLMRVKWRVPHDHMTVTTNYCIVVVVEGGGKVVPFVQF